MKARYLNTSVLIHLLKEYDGSVPLVNFVWLPVIDRYTEVHTWHSPETRGAEGLKEIKQINYLH